MPAVNVVDELFIVADPVRVRAVVCDRERWAQWLPGIALAPYQDRGRLGVRWTVTGDLVGTAEVWLEEHGDGVVVHAYLRADPADPARQVTGSRRYALPLKWALLQVKDDLEGDRVLGSARVPLGERVVSSSDSGRVDRRSRHQRSAGTGSKGTASDGRPDHLEHPDIR